MRKEVLAYLEQQLVNNLSGRTLDCCAGPVDYGLANMFPEAEVDCLDQIDCGRGVRRYICDVHDLADVPAASYDAVFCLEAIEHIRRPWLAAEAFERVLLENGTLVLTTVMDFPIHRHPRDYWRFCPDGLASLLDGFRIRDFTIEGRREKPQGLWLVAEKRAGDWHQHNLDLAAHPTRVHNGLTRWFGFKENIHYRIARTFFRTKAKPPSDNY